MRVFFQGKDESVVINDEIVVTVIDIDGDEVVLAIEAPEWIEIDGNGPERAEEDMENCGLMRPR